MRKQNDEVCDATIDAITTKASKKAILLLWKRQLKIKQHQG